MTPSRPRGPHDRESNHRTPAADAPSERLPSLAGNLSRVSLPHARDAAFSFDGHPGLVPINGCAAILNFGLTLRHEPGSQALRQCPERRESSCLSHVHSMRWVDGKSAVQEYAG